MPLPLQAYFRINGENTGQFERTLIIADEGSKVHYIEGCTAPIYTTDALHAAVVEVIALPGAKIRYTTIQNWSRDVYNLVTKRAHAHENATVEWVDANTGCLTPETLVYTNNDVVPISAVRPGDHVYSLTPDFEIARSRVAATRVNPPEPVFDLVLQNHRRVRATANHPFLVLRKVGRTRRVGWLPVASIVDGDEVAVVGQLPDHGTPHRFAPVPIRPRSRKPFRAPAESTEELMWLLGFYIGDGYLDGPNRVAFAVPDADPACRRVIDLVDRLFGLGLERSRGIVLRAASATLVDWLAAAGFTGNAHSKRLPAWVFRLPHAQKRALIDGYIAADGHARPGPSQRVDHERQPRASRAGPPACDLGRPQPVEDLEYRRTEKLPLGREVKEYRTHFLYFYDEILGAPVHFVPVAEITYSGESATVDIEVEGTANFVANGVFAHNSRLSMKYPAIYLRGGGATAEVISVAFAGHGQHQDTGAKAIHLAPNTRSRIVSKSVSKDGGRATYRGTLQGGARRDRRRGQRPLRRAPPRRGEPLRHLPLHRHPGGRHDDDPRGHRREDLRRPDLLPHEPGADRERGARTSSCRASSRSSRRSSRWSTRSSSTGS